MDENSKICAGQSSCISLVIMVLVVLIAILFNYMVTRCITLNSEPPDPSLPTTVPPNTPLANHGPLLRRALKSIPALAYDAAPSAKDGCLEMESCAVCLAEFEEGEGVRVLPRCSHVYHVECIDKWLLRSLHCPICRERVFGQQIIPKGLMESREIDLTRNNNNNNIHPLPIIVPFDLNMGNTHVSDLL